MRVEKIGLNNETSFKKLKIVSPEMWPAEVLDTFVKNKEVQELAKEWDAKNKDLSGCYYGGARRAIVNIFMDLDIVHTIEAKDNFTLQKNTEKFSRKDIVIPRTSKEDQERLDNVNNYIDEFNKTLSGENKQPQTLPKKQTITTENHSAAKPKTFWEKLKGMFNK